MMITPATTPATPGRQTTSMSTRPRGKSEPQGRKFPNEPENPASEKSRPLQSKANFPATPECYREHGRPRAELGVTIRL